MIGQKMEKDQNHQSIEQQPKISQKQPINAQKMEEEGNEIHVCNQINEEDQISELRFQMERQRSRQKVTYSSDWKYERYSCPKEQKPSLLLEQIMKNSHKLPKKRQSLIESYYNGYVNLPKIRSINTHHKTSPIIINQMIQILLGFEFKKNLTLPSIQKIPLTFQSFYHYQKVFQKMLINEVIADIHGRMKSLQSLGQGNLVEQSQNQSVQIEQTGISIIILQLGSMQKGFVPIYIKQKSNNFIDRNDHLKKFLSERYSLVILSNRRYFRLEDYGLKQKANDDSFAILCMVSLPQIRPRITSQIQLKLYGFFDRSNLQQLVCKQSLKGYIQFEKDRHNKIFYLHSLDKISSHIRQYNSIKMIHQSPLFRYLMNPLLLISEDNIQTKYHNTQIQNLLKIIKQKYNEEQYLIIKHITQKQNGIYMLQGPPGTGKTTTLLGMLAVQYQSLRQLQKINKQSRKILVCAPSNATIDHIAKLILQKGLISHNNTIIKPKILRVGRNQKKGAKNKKSKIDKQILQISLEHMKATKVKVLQQQNIRNQRQKKSYLQRKLDIQKLQKNANAIERQIKAKQNQLSAQEVQNKNSQVRQMRELISRKIRNLGLQPCNTRLSNQIISQQVQIKILRQAEIILTTLNSSGVHNILQYLKGKVQCLIVDQAVQATQPSLLVPMNTLCNKVVLIGDPCQLPSMMLSKLAIKSDSQQDKNLDRSLFERLLDCENEPYFLNKQYRMAEKIRQFPSIMFYENRLIDAPCIASRYKQKQASFQFISHFLKQQNPNNNIFIDVSQGREDRCPGTKSFKNQAQIALLLEILINIIRQKSQQTSVGVITPYSFQAVCLRRQLKNSLDQQWKSYQNTYGKFQAPQPQIGEQFNMKEQGQLSQSQYYQLQKNIPKQIQLEIQKFNPQKNPLHNIHISTVDSFQGKECDIIVLSTVRAHPQKEGQIGFIKDYRRLNVALTRGKHLLFFVGNFDTLYEGSKGQCKGGDVIKNILKWYIQNNSYHKIKSNKKQDVRQFVKGIWKGQKPSSKNQSLYKKLRCDQQIIGFKSAYKIKTKHLQKLQRIQLQKIERLQKNNRQKNQNQQKLQVQMEQQLQKRIQIQEHRSAQICKNLKKLEEEIKIKGQYQFKGIVGLRQLIQDKKKI